MKKRLLVLTLATCTLAMPAMAGDTLFGGLGDAALKLKNTFRSTIETEAVSLETDGGNPRVYVYDAPGNKYYTCYFVAATQKGGVGCYPKQAVTEALLRNSNGQK